MNDWQDFQIKANIMVDWAPDSAEAQHARVGFELGLTGYQLIRWVEIHMGLENEKT
jgi:hypothetical protein